MSRVRRLTALIVMMTTLPAGERFSFSSPVTMGTREASSTMDVYMLWANPNGFRRLEMVRESDLTVLDGLRGHPAGGAWEPLEVQAVEEHAEDGALPLADFHMLGETPAFSQRAVDALGDLLTVHGELLPLRSAHGTWYVYRVTRVIDALDERGTYVIYYTTGRRIGAVFPRQFYPERLSAPILKVPQRPTRVYVTSDFVARVREAGLTGFEFLRMTW